jgi:predicted ester cyclase
MTTVTSTPNIELCRHSLDIMGHGERSDFASVVHPKAVNREAKDEPADCRGHGPDAFYATALWLRSAFSDLRWDVHDAVASGDLVVLHVTMSGRQSGPFVNYGDNAEVTQAMPATGRQFAITQTHWFRIADGLVIEHWANRDDVGMAQQLGWIPPTPAFLLRAALATRRATRAAPPVHR